MQIKTPACSPSQPKALECLSMASWSLCTFRNKDVSHRYLWIDNVFSIEDSKTIICISIMAHKVRTVVTITGSSRHRQSGEKSACHPERQQLPKTAEHVLLLFVWWSSVPACLKHECFLILHAHTYSVHVLISAHWTGSWHWVCSLFWCVLLLSELFFVFWYQIAS